MKHKAEAKKVDYAAVVYIYFNNSIKYAFQDSCKSKSNNKAVSALKTFLCSQVWRTCSRQVTHDSSIGTSW